MNEVADLITFLYLRLKNDAALAALVQPDPEGDGPGVYEGAAPEGAEYPFVVFSVLVSPDINGNGALRVATRPLVRIYAVGQTESLVSLGPLANRIDALFGDQDNQARGVQGGLQVAGSHRERPFAPPPEAAEGGVIYRRLGGEYRLFVYAAP
jgi:hypothetical protein